MIARRLAAAPLLVLLASVAMVACDDEATRSEDRVSLLVVSESGAGLPQTFPSIAQVRLTAWNARTSTRLAERSFDADAQAADTRRAVESLPLGEDVVLFVEGLDSQGRVRASGGTRKLRVVEDDPAPGAPALVQLVPVNAFARSGAPYAAADGGLAIDTATFDDGPRAGHTATLLEDGRVLIVGGAELVAEGAGLAGTQIGAIRDGIVIYDPHVGYFEVARDRTGAPLRLGSARAWHTASRLSGNRVLVTGGLSPSEVAGVTTLRSVELIQPDPAGGFERVSLDPMAVARAHHTATVRYDGSVLVVGGESRDGDFVAGQSTAELFDPQTSTFRATEPLSVARAEHTATLLGDGASVLVAGGRDGDVVYASTELFTVGGDNRLRFVGTPGMSVPRFGHAAATVPIGEGRYVLFAGGMTPDGEAQGAFAPTSHVDIVDVVEGRYLPAGTLSRPRADFVLAAVGTGELLAAGGLSVDAGGRREVLAVGERLVFEAGQSPEHFERVDTDNLMQTARRDAAAVTLESGLVLITGGAGLASSVATSDLYSGGAPSGTTAAAAE